MITKDDVLHFLTSTGGAALITVLFGTIGGGFLNSCIQDRLKEREFQQEYIQALSVQAQTAYQEYLERDRQTLEGIYDLIGGLLAASENFVAITEEPFELANFIGNNYEATRQQRDDIVRAYNAATTLWRSQQPLLELQITYYRPDAPEVRKDWKRLVMSVDDFTACMRNLYLAEGDYVARGGAEPDDCDMAKEDVIEKLEEFSVCLAATHRYVWKGFETAESLMEIVDPTFRPDTP